jgi:hypothetical protein
MKKMFLTLVVAAISLMAYAEEKAEAKAAENKFDVNMSSGKLKKFVRKKICSIKDDVLTISGDTSSKSNGWRAVSIKLSFKSITGKAFEISGEAKAEKMQGKLQISVRQINEKGKTIKFVNIVITKDQDWTKFKKEFMPSSSTAKMELLIIARKMADDSIGSLKNISVKEIKL